MKYDAIREHDGVQDDDHDMRLEACNAPSVGNGHAAPECPLFLAHDTENGDDNTSCELSPTGFGHYLLNSITSRSTRTTASYEIVEEEDFEDRGDSPTSTGAAGQSSLPLRTPRPRPIENSRTLSSTTREPIVRTASGRSVLRHPTPDLQVLRGAYTGNVQLLERTAERLSMTSSIDDAIRELHVEQKRHDSRKSSLMSSPDLPLTRQFSNGSIVDTNNIARSGGYSPAAFMMSPKGSFTAGSGGGRPTSKSSRYGARPEPEMEGRPLDSFVGLSMPEPTSPFLSRSASIAEQDESSNTVTRPVVDLLDVNTKLEGDKLVPSLEEELPITQAATNTFDHVQMEFEGFDGVHSTNQQVVEDCESENSQRGVTPGDRQSVAGSDVNSQRRVSSGNRPQTYADPSTGQQMVYYPAPVPMMLNLPQKLSKLPSSMARNKRRSQVLSSIPQNARQSAIWLPDVLETEDEPELQENDETQHLEYVPQHQRMSMGGRRLTQDIQHLPPQLRANAFFELPGPNQVVEMKEQSAVATLDSILDASAHAPVTAFTDHAFAGHLGAEVYGRSNMRNSKSSSQLLQPDGLPKRRTSSFDLLRGRRASSSDLLESENEKRANTISDIRAGKIIRDPLDEEDDETSPLAASEADDQEDEIEEMYHGAPTTLLAELQLRKQQAKNRTRPVASAYPNGIRSTLMELDAVAQVEQRSRKQKRIHLAWEDPDQVEEDDMDDDEEVPLALLYAKKSQIQEPNRPMGLMERRDMEDNEPLSRRRDRLQGRPPAMMPRASTMMNLHTNAPEVEGETLAQRVLRLKGEESPGIGLPATRPVSGDFASEMMSQFGGDLVEPKGKGKEIPAAAEEDETLGQRRKRLQAEREARAVEVGNNDEAQERPKMQSRRSMADLLSAHPAAGASRVPSYSKGPSNNGLLGLHEREKLQRASTMFNLDASQLPTRQANAGMYDGHGGILPPQSQMQRQSSYNLFPQPNLGMGYNAFGNQMMMPFVNPYTMGGMPMNGMNGMGYVQNPMAAMNMNMMQMAAEPLNQGQSDMVERWRQSVMQ
ncbi:hypothetical protein D0Z07_0740 [Hyphodiscus hymeniophilus]|uniref:Uncharacterized protein n=1 Tax=Hyphodiscus hymeniophilus TaxID=353542 RepID=A0A9P6VRU4_9HELO|nr:hypothetical protein D0Z07_0740 [Hyphodiscus hymeniophilus]